MKVGLPLLAASVGFVAWAAQPGQTGGPTVSYDREVLPILSQKCFKCHGPDAGTAAAGLRLDSFDLATKDGAVVPGSPEKSLLIKRTSAHEMPPPDSGAKPLTATQIEILARWIQQGAKYEKHWSYVPPVQPPLPKVSDPAWCKNALDKFVMAKLDAEGLTPEPLADKHTLALRAAETLTGLPPTKAELDNYLKDAKSGSYERYVDRLLAKHAYGEHMARYWLDAVRYGDTHGLQLDNERGVFPYRDWVVRAYNQDLPFDKFVTWQMAGDLLPNPTTEQRIATGYVRMNITTNEGGAIAEEFLARNTFDRVDTTSTVMLGLTVQCAKCHDHKYDPVKQSDYYGLYAFFNSTKDAPLDGNILLPPPFVKAATPEDEARLLALGNQLSALRGKVDAIQAAAYFDAHKAPVPTARDWQISLVNTYKSFDEAFDTASPGEPGQNGITRWTPFSYMPGKPAAGIVGRDNSSVYVRGTLHLEKAGRVGLGVSSDDAVKVWLNGKLIHSNKTSRGVDQAIDQVTADLRAGDNELIVKIVNGAGPDGMNIRIGSPDAKRIADALAAHAKGDDAGLKSAYLELGPETTDATLYRSIAKQKADYEASIPMSLTAEEMEQPRPTFMLKRGQYDQPGDKVVRHLPAAWGAWPKGAPMNRLGLARWLVSPQNPLVSRVFVNRMWQQHFGTGIVKTVEDFGSQGEWPMNQPLLDYLATRFQQDGWSMKKLNRLIVTSATFRQVARADKTKLGKDPENRLLSRGPRFRLDAEAIRDKALFASGLLLQKVGGHGFKTYQPDGIWEGASDPASSTHFYNRDKDQQIYRRSLYMFWKRTAPPPAMITFDAPLRDTCVVRRSLTNTPLQALTTLNETTFLEASRVMAQRVMATAPDDPTRLKVAFETAFSRPANTAETKLLADALTAFKLRYVNDPGAADQLVKVGDAAQAKVASYEEVAAWMLLCSTLMNTDEFLTQH